MLEGKKIIIGVCGSIAAYKTAFLIRLLVKSGAEVKVVMTEAAKDFITPLTLGTVSKNPVLSHFGKPGDTGEWENHVDLGLWADLMVIAPASANTLGKFANGLCDNLLSAVYLSARCPIMLAPAMDLDMYQHPAVKANLERLKSFGHHIIDAEHGELASGLVGTGRMAEPEHLVRHINDFFSKKKDLLGKTALVTAGPTYEAIDPVRFIGNHSSGKMGMAIAEQLAREGASVHLIAGPGNYDTLSSSVNLHNVRSADEMYDSADQLFPSSDIAVFAAAVADYKPKQAADQKIKKKGDTLELTLVKNKDIALEMGAKKQNGQLTVGFALETENEAINAQKKLENKNLDLIVLNSLNDRGAGFSHDTNKITIFSKKNDTLEFPLKSKKEVAFDIVEAIKANMHA